ncbi:MAG TPA: ABC transporter permease [Baekduia sp.]|nr:ABC transporter permease [Baekduia sp.]
MIATTSATETVETPLPATRKRSLNLGRVRDYAVLIFLLALIVALSISTSTFLTLDNFKNVLETATPLGMVACAGTIVIVSGGLDLSAGAIFLVASILAAKVSNDVSPAVGIVAGLLVGCGLGAINGLLTTVGRVNPFVGTLGTMTAFGGLAVVLSGSGLIFIEDPAFGNVADTQILGFALSTWLLVVVALLCGFLLNRTIFGQHAFGTGGNLVAARLSGVPINRTLTYGYMLSGTVAALAGIIIAARTLSISPAGGSALIFDALAAILIGGNSVFGGAGAIWRTMVGVLIITLIANGFNLLGVDPIYQQVVSGILILVAVSSDAWVRRSN